MKTLTFRCGECGEEAYINKLRCNKQGVVILIGRCFACEVKVIAKIPMEEILELGYTNTGGDGGEKK